ncbi:MAG: citrate synthase/methylcitrate synthase [Actinomycetota bacterium]|nr:citrate synthase/methylcitrate synthase [Actinomycetota bacterium]
MATTTPDEPDQLIDVPAGLRGVAVTDTRLGDVRGAQGFFHYRQYSATDLARTRSLEDVWQLLLDGELPTTAAERDRFTAEIGPLRTVPDEVSDAVAGIARHGGAGLGGLRTALSLLAQADDMPPLWDSPPQRRRRDLLRLAAATPTLIAALWRHSHGLEPIAPDPTLGHIADYLHMLGGTPTDTRAARAVEQYAMLTVDHGFNASTFTARVVASTGADAGSAVVAALGALSGPLHGGAPSRALQLLEAIGEPSRAAAWVRAAIERNERIMGFGHAVYRGDDPRSLLLRHIAQDLGGDLADFAISVEAIITATLAELRPDRHLYANVEYYAGVVMATCGIDRQLFTPTFAVGRTIGWTANIAEQAADRRIIRPAARYTGPPPPQPVPELNLDPEAR